MDYTDFDAHQLWLSNTLLKAPEHHQTLSVADFVRRPSPYDHLLDPTDPSLVRMTVQNGLGYLVLLNKTLFGSAQGVDALFDAPQIGGVMYRSDLPLAIVAHTTPVDSTCANVTFVNVRGKAVLTGKVERRESGLCIFVSPFVYSEELACACGGYEIDGDTAVA